MGQGVTLIPLVCVSIINVGSGFLSKIWILAFLGKYSNIFVGSQSVSIEVRIRTCLLQVITRVSVTIHALLTVAGYGLLWPWTILGEGFMGAATMMWWVIVGFHIFFSFFSFFILFIFWFCWFSGFVGFMNNPNLILFVGWWTYL